MNQSHPFCELCSHSALHRYRRPCRATDTDGRPSMP